MVAFPPVASTSLPWITTAQMVEVDRAMIEDFGISLLQMMENAGRSLAIVARERFLDGSCHGRVVWVLAGTGGNGGGALVCARRLAAWGAEVRVWTTRAAERFGPVPRHQLDIVRQMGIAIDDAGLPPSDVAPDIVVDGLVGYSLSGAPRGRVATLIGAAAECPAPVLALDAPSGVDTASGTRFEPAITATATVTLALPKRGLRSAASRDAVGELYLADISVPPAVYSSAALDLPFNSPFGSADIVRIVD